eukprot:364219-Chlamydomonas_euryale.AAC.5
MPSSSDRHAKGRRPARRAHCPCTRSSAKTGSRGTGHASTFLSGSSGATVACGDTRRLVGLAFKTLCAPGSRPLQDGQAAAAAATAAAA